MVDWSDYVSLADTPSGDDYKLNVGVKIPT